MTLKVKEVLHHEKSQYQVSRYDKKETGRIAELDARTYSSSSPPTTAQSWSWTTLSNAPRGMSSRELQAASEKIGHKLKICSSYQEMITHLAMMSHPNPKVRRSRSQSATMNTLTQLRKSSSSVVVTAVSSVRSSSTSRLRRPFFATLMKPSSDCRRSTYLACPSHTSTPR